MKVVVEAISMEMIKPSSPTPDHLRQYHLSFLDQISPPVYSSLVCFYDFNPNTQPQIPKISNHFKKSLAQVLALFYPLAGRVKDSLHIDCNDQGIPYLEARLNCTLADFLTDPDVSELSKFVPFELDDLTCEFFLGVQLNVFNCGGFAIGYCFPHKLGDGLSMIMFMKTWAATARRILGDNQARIDRPEFISATLFPPKLVNQYDSRIGITKNKVTRRFVFDAANIDYLRSKYGDLTGQDFRPSRVEILSAFLWSRFVAATKDDNDHKAYRVMHAVNLRPRFDPPLPPCSFGNLSRLAGTIPSLLNYKEESYGLARLVRQEINKVDKDYIKSLQKGDGHLNFITKYAGSFTRGETVTCNYTSLCGFPLYDTDFGWGRPAWVGLPALPFNNLTVFLDTKEGDGVEAYVSLSEDIMGKFENDHEFLRHLGAVSVTSGLKLTRRPILFSRI